MAESQPDEIDSDQGSELFAVPGKDEAPRSHAGRREETNALPSGDQPDDGDEYVPV